MLERGCRVPEPRRRPHKGQRMLVKPQAGQPQILMWHHVYQGRATASLLTQLQHNLRLLSPHGLRPEASLNIGSPSGQHSPSSPLPDVDWTVKQALPPMGPNVPTGSQVISLKVTEGSNRDQTGQGGEAEVTSVMEIPALTTLLLAAWPWTSHFCIVCMARGWHPHFQSPGWRRSGSPKPRVTAGRESRKRAHASSQRPTQALKLRHMWEQTLA